MSDRYRVRIRRGSMEVEVESSDKAYVESKLRELLEDLPQKGTLHSAPRKPAAESKSRKRRGTTADGRVARSNDELLRLIHHIQQHEDYTAIDKRILSKRAQLPRILMCLYYAAECFDEPYVTTGEVEVVTDQLGVRILRTNATKALKRTASYVQSDTVRKQGAVVGYKLTRSGIEHFKSLLRNPED